MAAQLPNLQNPAALAAPILAPGSPRGKGERRDYVISKEDFAAKVAALVKAFVHILEVAEKVYSLEAGKGLKVMIEGVAYGKGGNGGNSVISLRSGFKKELEDLARYFRASVTDAGRVKRESSGKTNDQLLRTFFISDQLVAFFKEAKYGNGLAGAFATHPQRDAIIRMDGADPAVVQTLVNTYAQGGISADQILTMQQQWEQTVHNQDAAKKKNGSVPHVAPRRSLENFDVKTSLDLIFQQRMANPTVMVSLFYLIRAANGLSSRSNGLRAHYDATWVKHFDGTTNTRFILQGTDLSGYGDQVAATIGGAKEQEAFRAKFVNLNASAFTRLAQHKAIEVKRKDAPNGKAIYPVYIPQAAAQAGTDDWGIMMSGFMVLSNFFRIPNELVLALGQEGLSERLAPPVKDAEGKIIQQNPYTLIAVATQQYIHTLLAIHGVAAEPEKKERAKARRQAKTPSKRAPVAPQAVYAPAAGINTGAQLL